MTTVRVAILVFVIDDHGTWYCDSYLPDYAAETGLHLDDARERYAKGIVETIKAHFERFGHADRFLAGCQPTIGELVPGKTVSIPPFASCPYAMVGVVRGFHERDADGPIVTLEDAENFDPPTTP